MRKRRIAKRKRLLRKKTTLGFQSKSSFLFLNVLVTNFSSSFCCFRKIPNIKDGSNELKEQITHSVERMKAARYGHSIKDIFREHDYSFYLPEKTTYLPK